MNSGPIFRSCPGCRQKGLASTGAFLRCGHCGYAITAQALARELPGAASSQTPQDPARPLRETG